MVYCDFSMTFRKEIVEMYDALTVAEYVIKYSTLSGMPVSNLRLQKVLYFIQAEFMVSTNSECFNDRIEAWDLGPVVPTVYRKYKVFGASSIPIDSSKDAERIINSKDRKMMNETINHCNKYSTSTLIEITHNQDPWIKARNSCFSKVISPESLYEYFKEE